MSRFIAIALTGVTAIGSAGLSWADEYLTCCAPPPPCGCEVVVDPCGGCTPVDVAKPEEIPQPEAQRQPEATPTPAPDTGPVPSVARPTLEPQPTPPVEAEPTPPVDTPPVFTPTPYTPPVETPPADTPPADTQPTPPVEDIFGGEAAPTTPAPTTPTPTDPATDSGYGEPPAPAPSTDAPAETGEQPAPAEQPTTPAAPEADDLFDTGAALRVLDEPGGWASESTRQWSDASGRHACEARLVRATADTVVLDRADGSEVVVNYSALSDADLQFVRRQIDARRTQLAAASERDLVVSQSR